MSISTKATYDSLINKVLFHKHQELVEALEAMGALTYKGIWNANTNTPAIASGVGTKGYYYVVSVAGTTSIDGVADWQVGDWIIFNGTIWQKADHTDVVSSVFGRQGAVVAGTNDYTWAQINKGTSSIADITTRSHTSLTDIGTRTHAQIDAQLSAVPRTIGVTGSGASYECDGTDDNVQFAQAIADMSTGDVLSVLSGTYVFSSVVDINKSISIIGQDRTLSIISASGNLRLFELNASGICLEQLGFVNLTEPWSLLRVLSGNGDRIENCSFSATGIGAMGIEVGVGSAHMFARNIFDSSTSIEFSNSTSKCIILYNIFGYTSNTLKGLLLDGASSASSSLIFGNAFWNTISVDIKSNTFDVVIESNTFRGVAGGASISIDDNATAAPTNIIVTKNTWRYDSGGKYCVSVKGGVGINIEGNIFGKASDDFVYVGVSTNSRNSSQVLIVNNNGVTLPTGGITEDTGSDYTVLSGNLNLGVITLTGANSLNRDSGVTPLDVEITDATKGIILRTAEGDRVRCTVIKVALDTFTLSFNAIV